MFSNWEIGGETWGYWYFARVFAETGGFIVPDRGSLYTLYLNLFTWLPYPASVTAEYLVTTSITVMALVAFFRPYLGIWLALLAACFWIPYLQTAEPPVQKLALASSLIGVLLRENKSDRFGVTSSYAFFGLAYMFRGSYALLIVVFAVHDVLKIIRQRAIKALIARPRISSYWPAILIMVLFFWFAMNQSPHRWNNAWITTTKWFPPHNNSLATASFVGHYNWRYIDEKYGTYVGHDFYFTHQEAFRSATGIIGMIQANPRLFMKILFTNITYLFPTAASLMLPISTGGRYIDYFLKLLVLVAVIYGALRASQGRSMTLFIIGNILLVVASAISYPKGRYMFPMIPIFIMSASWYGAILTTFLKKLYPSTEKLFQKMALAIFAMGILSLLFYSITDSSTSPLKGTFFLSGTILAFFCASILFAVGRFAKARLRIAMNRFALALPTILLLVIFSGSNVLGWASILHGAVDDLGHGRLGLLEGKKASMKRAFPTLASITRGCRGIMSLEPTFFGAFLDIPQDRVYAVWEIPPFGHLHNSPYKGLNPDRIDCVLVSTGLATGIGMATNHQIRYQNFIKPYIDQLISCGAVQYEIPFYGYAIVLQKKRN